jgi:phosphoglycerol transferase
MHFNSKDLLGGLSFFHIEFIIILIVFLVLTLSLYWIGSKVTISKIIPKVYGLIVIAFAMLIMCFKGGALRNIFDVVSIVSTTNSGFTSSLSSLGIPPDQYVYPEDVTAQKGKNIIVISLESLEKDYLEERFGHLTPNLRRFTETMTYFDMPQSPGSDWTTGAIYTLLTGVPAFFPGHGNQIFLKSKSIQLTGISHVLKKAGYNISYLIGNAEFGGLKELLSTYGISVKSARDFGEDYPSIPSFGVHDKDLFNEVKKSVMMSKAKGEPFALFISTISTHHPNGIYDKRMEKWVGKQDSNLECMVASVDYLLGDLLNFLEKNQILANTSIFILPDHLIMGKTAPVLRYFSKNRGLYLITNAQADKLSYRSSEKIYQMDLPKIILQGAEIKHNAKFLTDFIKGRNIKKFIEDNKKKIFALNMASLKKVTWSGDISITLNSDGSITFKSNDAKLFIKNSELKRKPIQMLVFNDDMRLKTNLSVTLKALSKFRFEKKFLYLIVKPSNQRLSAYLKKGTGIGSLRIGPKKVIYQASEIEAITEWDNLLPHNPDPPQSTIFTDLVRLTSSNHKTNQRSPARITVGNRQYPLFEGINLLFQENGRFLVRTFDNRRKKKRAQLLIPRLEGLIQKKKFFAMVVYGNVDPYFRTRTKRLKNLGFEKLAQLKQEVAYIGYSYQGFISEYVAKNTLSLVFPAQELKTLRSDTQIQQDAKDVNRFIAHAGGEIEGLRYTNSLEALNRSYKNGFRLFELDIIKTSDGKYVAAHDWPDWAKKTGYSGFLPASSEEFLQYKIYRKFTPLDIKGINNWFLNHPDAILVTDKTDEAAQFSNMFVDKKRLMMELSTLKAIREGIKAGIKSAMASQKLIEELEGDKVAVLKKMGIKDVAVSRKMIPRNIPFFKALQANNIKAYVYNVNFEIGKDEAYVVWKEMDYIYGLYADKWRYLRK